MQKYNNKHENYEILNLLGYGLAKFDKKFIKEFGYNSKSAFYQYFVDVGLVDTPSVVKNRMDLFDPFFPNARQGWWQKGDTYIHRKELIDSLFGKEDVKGFAQVVKLFLQEKYKLQDLPVKVKPIIRSRYKQMQQTGLEAELYFLKHYHLIEAFENGHLEDARLYGDGYDFQIDVDEQTFLTEVKGIRAKKGRFRLTQKEYLKAQEYKSAYIITIVMNLDENPRFITIDDPLKNLSFEKRAIQSKLTTEYYLKSDIS